MIDCINDYLNWFQKEATSMPLLPPNPGPCRQRGDAIRAWGWVRQPRSNISTRMSDQHVQNKQGYRRIFRNLFLKARMGGRTCGNAVALGAVHFGHDGLQDGPMVEGGLDALQQNLRGLCRHHCGLPAVLFNYFTLVPHMVMHSPQ
jgi:hypothetical protein